ncbi:hypothetical protein GE061_000112 [Apolygus lucorum]|uniref:Hemolymph juvenile hormone binding protein n=1 Tax=Apolygus lucorum TaxID=248454 RepID=A0A8S9Y3G5_APOLU|nr:hypothetical protein GE061_000112 [Apolygus lucorum]
MLSVLPLLFLSLDITAVLSAGALPNGWKTCKRSDPNIEKCLTEAAQGAVTSVVKSGVKKYGVFPAEPLRFNELMVDQSNGPVNVKLGFTDLDVFGLKDIKIIKANWNKGNLDIEASVPKLVVKGNYEVNGKVLVLPIVGTGKSNITIDKAYLVAQLQLSENAKGKVKYFKNEKMLLKVTGKKVYFKFDNLFNGDKRLGDNMNVFLNENWELIWEEVQPAISASLGQAVKEISNRIFGKVPSTEISPP